MSDVFVDGFGTEDLMLQKIDEYLKDLVFYELTGDDVFVQYDVDQVRADMTRFVRTGEDPQLFNTFARKKHMFIHVMLVFGKNEVESDDEMSPDYMYEALYDTLTEMYEEYMEFPTTYSVGQDQYTGDWVVCAYILNSNPSTGYAFSSGYRQLFDAVRKRVTKTLEHYDVNVNAHTDYGERERNANRVHRDKILSVLQSARKKAVLKNDDDLISYLYQNDVPSIINGSDLLCTAKDSRGQYRVIKAASLHSVYRLKSIRALYV